MPTGGSGISTGIITLTTNISNYILAYRSVFPKILNYSIAHKSTLLNQELTYLQEFGKFCGFCVDMLLGWWRVFCVKLAAVGW